MANTTITLSEQSLAKLKWLKNRYEFLIDGQTLSWDNFFDGIILTVLPTLAEMMRDKNEAFSKFTKGQIMSMLVGGFAAVDEIMKEKEEDDQLGKFRKFEMR